MELTEGDGGIFSVCRLFVRGFEKVYVCGISGRCDMCRVSRVCRFFSARPEKRLYVLYPVSYIFAFWSEDEVSQKSVETPPSPHNSRVKQQDKMNHRRHG